MTNYRLWINPADEEQFKYCFTCGSPLKKEIKENEESLTCSNHWVHCRIFLNEDEDDVLKIE